MQVRFLRQFLKTESASGLFLLISAILAIILANSPASSSYNTLVKSSLFLVNDIFMALFFLLVGLELKREMSVSFKLSNIRLPVTAALGGMIIPALLYAAINNQSPTTFMGWSIPVATDIAFALGTLSLFGQRVPTSLKVFLMSLAIFDDIGAILIIAFFYASPLSWLHLAVAFFTIGALFICKTQRIQSMPVYLGLGVLLWYALLKAGIHPTISGIILALFIPHQPNSNDSPLSKLEKNLHPWVAFGIMPLFALCNAGFPLSFNQVAVSLKNPLVIGTIVGLFVGKPLGVFGFTWILIRLGFASLPRSISWGSLYGVSLLCGIGFTMSLFLGNLSFAGQQAAYLADVRIGVITGSLLSGTTGALVLWSALLKRNIRK